MDPDCCAAAANARIFSPCERERFAATKLGGHHELKMRKSAILDLCLDCFLIDEFSHECILPSPEAAELQEETNFKNPIVRMIRPPRAV